MALDGAVKGREDAGLAGMGRAVLDFEALAALLAKPLDRLFPFYVCEKLVGRGSRRQDEVFVFCALFDEVADLVLSSRISMGKQRAQ